MTTEAPTTTTPVPEVNIAELLLDKTETSNYRRQFISIYENRLDAISVGLIGSVIILIIILSLIISDTPRCIQHAKQFGIRNIRKRDYFRYRRV